ncbi:hypothetical protein L6164_021066 [Bauhinia variegata]|uniref:Uncharacterized protein n=1 Tax=Bauhinia variegata TaxID=167791 RepID=A0ACB9MXE1_BAUVA|nr:hypothetical protein L6164_021066 [Bauhinia variegata]
MADINDLDPGIDENFLAPDDDREEEEEDKNINENVICVEGCRNEKKVLEEGDKGIKRKPALTKYERARVLGARALQISMNAPVMVPLDGQVNPLEIAMKELYAGKLPFIIRRYFPDGSYEEWPVADMEDPYSEYIR